MNFDRILMEIAEHDPTLDTEYWAIPYSEALESAFDGVVSGVFIATLNDGSKWFLIPRSVDLATQYPSLFDDLMEDEVLGYLNYINSKSGVGPVPNA